MKRLNHLLVLTCLLTLCLLVLSSCGAKLNAPRDLELDIDTQTLHWNTVKGAAYYTVKITGQQEEINTLTTWISLEFLEPGVYDISVKAVSENGDVDDSKWATYPDYERYSESGLKYELINNEREYRLVSGGTASGDVVMESTYRNKPVTEIAPKALYNNTKITSFTIGDYVTTIGEKAFTKCAKLVSVTAKSENLTSIGQYAFQSCKSLTSVTLPNTVTEIKAHTFAWCSALTDVTLSSQLKSIEEYAFSNCSSLTKITYHGLSAADGITFPGTLKNVDQYAFTDCVSLATVDLGDGVEYIGVGAFMNCKLLADIDLGLSLTKIEETAFQYCYALTSVIIPDSTEYIGNGAFINCTSLTDVTFGSGLKEVGFSVFDGTPIIGLGLDTVIIDGWLIYLVTTSKNYTIPEGVYGIASYASSKNAVIEQINLKGVKYVCEAAFYDCPSLYKVIFDDALITLGEAAFYSCKKINSVTLGNSLVTIGNYVFFDCELLGTKEDDEFVIPSTVTSIGTQAFRNTYIYKKVKDAKDKGPVYVNVTSYVDENEKTVTPKWVVDFVSPANVYNPMYFDDNTLGIASYALAYQSLFMVSISDSVKYIGRGAFYKSSIVTIKLPASLLEIGDYAFYNCYITNFGSDKYDLVIPDGTLTIGKSAFYSCESILSLDVPASVQSIGDFAFYGCLNIGATYDLEVSTGETDEDGLEIKDIMPVTGYITLSEGLTSIGNRAFQGCISMIDLTIPNSVTSIGERAFYNCTGLKNVVVGGGIDAIGDYMFDKCTALESVVLSEGITSIGRYAFRGCTALKSIELESIVSIGDYAFYECSALTSIDLPDTLTTIGNYTFRKCSSLVSVTLPESVTYIGKHAFYGLNSTTIYCEGNSPEGWDSKYNSSFRPVIWGCELSDDGSYVASIVVNNKNVENTAAINGISDPTREGYVFAGWTTVNGGTTAEYSNETLTEAGEGTVLYAIWLVDTNN